VQKIENILNKNKNVGLDTMLFIYLFENNEKYSDICEFIFGRIEKGLNIGIVSNLPLFEFLVGKYKADSKISSKKYVDIFLNMPNLKMFYPNTIILDYAAKIRAKYATRSMDSICYATSKVVDADIFITNDKDLLKIKDKKAKPKVIILEEYL